MKTKFDKVYYLGTVAVVFTIITMFIRDAFLIDKIIVIIPATALVLFLLNKLLLKNINILTDCMIHWRIYFIIGIIVSIMNKISKKDNRNVLNQLYINDHHKDKSYSWKLNIILIRYIVLIIFYSKFTKFN